MNYKLSIVLFALLLLTSCNNSNTTSLDELNLKGRVLSVKAISYEAESKFGEIVKGDIDFSGNSLFSFNEAGMIIDKSFYDWDGDLDRKEISVYDEKGRISEVNEYDEDGDLYAKTVFEFVDDIIVSQIRYDVDGEVEFHIKYENDGRNIIRGEYIVSEYNKGDYWENKLNGSKLVESISYDNKGGKGSTSTYNTNTKLVKVELPDYSIEVSYNETGDVDKTLNARFTEHSFSIHEEGSVYYYEYEYDSNNNWVKRITYKGEHKKPELITERIIKYYN